MAFFEQLGKKLTDAGQGISQQTKNMADVAKLNSAISDRKKQVAAAYAALGEAYYLKHMNDEEPEYPEVTALNEHFDAIRRAEDEIKVIKGVTKCEKCGADVPMGAQFCSSCGAPVPQIVKPEPAEAEQRLCPNCQKPVAPGNKFCTSCGTKLED